MNPSDIDFGNRIGNELKGTSSLHSPPAGLYPRVAERERQLNRHRTTHRAGTAGLVAIATIGGVAWMQSTRNATTPTSQPDATHQRLPAPMTIEQVEVHIDADWLERVTTATFNTDHGPFDLAFSDPGAHAS